MRVFVTGATGAIGRYAVEALVAAGHDVSALARTEAKAMTLRDQGATAVSVSLFDRTELARAFAGHDVVANLASALPATHRYVFTSAWEPCRRVRTQGSAAVVDAAQAVVVALDAPAGTYNVVDNEPLTVRDNADAMADAIAVRPWVRSPGRLALLLGDRTTSLTRSLRVSNRRLRDTTSWQPVYPSVREGYREMARHRSRG